MSLVFIDSFNHYTTAQIARKWTTRVEGFANQVNISSGTGRHGGNSLRYTPNIGGNNYVRKSLTSQSTWILGVGFRTQSPIVAAQIFGVSDAGTTQIDVRLNATGTLSVTRNGTVLATSTATLTAGAYYYVELKTNIHNTTGTYEVRVYGAAVIGPTTGANTRATSNNSADQVFVGSPGVTGGNTILDWCDFYACDGQGSSNNDFLGDVRVEAIFPNGNGNSSQFTGSDGNSTDNYLLVDDTTSPDDDSTYVESSTAGHKDTYAMGNMSSTPSSIKGVQTCILGRKTDAGTRTICPVIRSGGTDYDGTTVSLGDSYLYHLQVYEQNPNTSAAWTGSGVDGMEAGVKLVG